MTVAVKNLGAEYITHMSAGLPFVLKGNIRESGEDKPLLITAQGQLQKMSGEIKEGDSVKREFEIRVDMYSEIVDGLPTIIYSRNPYKCILGGIDTAPDFNSNL